MQIGIDKEQRMILIVNMNVSLDKHYEMKAFVPNTVMRAGQVDNTPGGKGIHVANVLHALSEKCLVTGMLGGKTGEFIEEKMQERMLEYDFQEIIGETRSCLAFTTEDNIQTEVLEPGPEVSTKEYLQFIEKYTKLVQQASLVVCSGSVPRNVPQNVYEVLIRLAERYGRRVLLDTSGALLEAGIRAKPFFIKPNRDELEALCQRKLKSIDDVLVEIKKLLAQGIFMVAVSLGADGAVFGCGSQLYRIRIPAIKAENPVGSGDAFVAGMAVGILQDMKPENAAALAAACGTANAMEKESGFVRCNVVELLLEKIKVEAL